MKRRNARKVQLTSHKKIIEDSCDEYSKVTNLADSSALDISVSPPQLDDTWCQVSDDSFMKMEQQCDLDTTKMPPSRISYNTSKDETQLFDIDPPSELWNDSVSVTSIKENQFSIDSIQQIETGRPSTIIEETSSQMSSLNRGSDISTECSSKRNSEAICEDNSGTETAILQPAKRMINSLGITKRKYKFFTDENEKPELKRKEIANGDDKSNSVDSLAFESFENSVNISTNSRDEDENIANNGANGFNNTLEAIDFFIEEGRRRADCENNASTSPNSFSTVSSVPSSIFSCKRTKLLNELAGVELGTFSRRGPLIDLMESPIKDI